MVSFAQFWGSFSRFLRFLIVEVRLIGALGGSLLDLVGGAANLAGEVVELRGLCFAGAQILDRRKVTGHIADDVLIDDQLQT